MIWRVLLEGLGLGGLLILVCAVGIRNGAVGMVHLYEPAVQDRCVSLGLTTKEKIRKNSLIFKAVCLPGYIAYVLIFVYAVHGYVEERAWKLKKIFLKLMKFPGFYKKVPDIFCKQTPKLFGTAAGFAAKEIQTGGGVWRIDMTQCPYHDACVRYGCPELCPSFCDSDDITYDGLHPKLCWHRTKTLGRGDEYCDFCLKRTDIEGRNMI